MARLCWAVLIALVGATVVVRPASAAPETSVSKTPADSLESYLSAQSLGIQKTKLANGLTVVLNVERGTPLIAVSVTFPAGRDHGGAFLELFDSQRHWRALDVASDYELVRARGAVPYRSAGWEHSTFTQVLPTDELPFALWLEGRRLRRWAHASAAGVVTEFVPSFPFVEPERRALFALEQRAWAPGVELGPNRLYSCCFTPAGAVLTVTGDFDSDEARRLLAEHVGSWEIDPREPESPPGERQPDEVEALEGFDFDRVALGSPLPELSLGFGVAGANDPSHAAVTLAAELLEGGEGATSGIFAGSRELDRRVELSEARGRSLLAIHLSRRSPSRDKLLPKTVFDELRRLGGHPLALPALEALRKAALLRWLDQFASAKQRSELLGRYEVLHGDARLSGRYARDLAAVTPSDVQRVLATLTADRAVVLEAETPRKAAR